MTVTHGNSKLLAGLRNRHEAGMKRQAAPIAATSIPMNLGMA
jgi:hypothetical protein